MYPLYCWWLFDLFPAFSYFSVAAMNIPVQVLLYTYIPISVGLIQFPCWLLTAVIQSFITESFLEKWVWDGVRSMERNGIYFPTGACGLDVSPLGRVCKGLDGYEEGAQEPDGTHPLPSILCRTEPRSGALESRNLGLSRGCRLGQLLASVPLRGQGSGRHLKALWTGDMEKGQLEPEGPNRAEVTW